ncbi:prepilin-type N-terminal cleavage/methylation domain-containing protein [Alkalicoccobacillus gibsonii]|uniref:Prepilin-type N-terminal cleavage/methylation domain-containing protein n=1 Tax=Alkalicoccobacillus gibsonii TaxID=79881 RepID=A0ABU9VN33_9BACI
MGIKDRLKNEKGLTLIEVLASVAILLIVLGIGMAALMQSSVLTSKVQGESQDRQDMQVGLLELTKAVQSATDIKKGVDDYNFEIIDSENRTSKYWLVDGQLNSDSKDGQTQVEGIEKMTIQDGKGITLQIEDLEEPVVLATRGGLEVKTGLKEEIKEVEPPLRDADIVCRNGVFTYSKYTQFKEFVEQKNQWGNRVNGITCNPTGEGKLTISKELNVALSAGDIRIDTGQIEMAWNTKFSLSNGSIYLPYTNTINYKDSVSIYSSKNLVLPGIINMSSNGKLEVGGDFKDFTGLKSGDTNTIIIRGSSISHPTKFSEINLGSNTSLNVYGDMKGFNLLTTHSNPVNITINGIVSGQSVVLNNNTKFQSDNDIRLTGELKVSSTGNEIIAKGNVVVDGSANLHQALIINFDKVFYVGGNLDVAYSGSNKFNIGDKLIVKGNVDLHQKFTFNGKEGIWIDGNFTANNDLDISTKSNIVIRGDTKLQYAGRMTSSRTMHIGGNLHLSREAIVTSGDELYVEKGIKLTEKSKIIVTNDSYINGKIIFPNINSDSERYAFDTYGQLTYTGPVEGTINFPSNFSMFNAKSKELVSNLSTMNNFPKFPSKPN